ncbi:hypothetical protein QR680_003672 [Steinernema hermaphroditum]|uniref:Uncharacterized protein n=1 Tax=Steinernema hermaphroditum TaxID=289476 RepID=A0AA39HNE2_9BILA|nr:hypothetical protein QR680_003672 [Steinernema hermaphroditum]
MDTLSSLSEADLLLQPKLPSSTIGTLFALARIHKSERRFHEKRPLKLKPLFAFCMTLLIASALATFCAVVTVSYQCQMEQNAYYSTIGSNDTLLLEFEETLQKITKGNSVGMKAACVELRGLVKDDVMNEARQVVPDYLDVDFCKQPITKASAYYLVFKNKNQLPDDIFMCFCPGLRVLLWILLALLFVAFIYSYFQFRPRNQQSKRPLDQEKAVRPDV